MKKDKKYHKIIHDIIIDIHKHDKHTRNERTNFGFEIDSINDVVLLLMLSVSAAVIMWHVFHIIILLPILLDKKVPILGKNKH